MPDQSPLPVTERTRHRRLREQGSSDRTDLTDILAAGVICHLGVVVDGYPMVVPTAARTRRNWPARPVLSAPRDMVEVQRAKGSSATH
jgi:uncharacterized protein